MVLNDLFDVTADMQAIASPSGCEFMAVKPYHVRWRWAMMSQRKGICRLAPA